MTTIVFADGYLLMDKRKSISMIDTPTLARTTDPEGIEDHHVKIRTPTPSMQLPTPWGENIVAIGGYGNEVVEQMLLDSAIIGLTKPRVKQYYPPLDLSGMAGAPLSAGIILVFDSGHAIHFEVVPTALTDKVAQNLSNKCVFIRVTYLDKDTNYVISTSSEAKARLRLLAQVVPAVPVFEDSSTPEAMFLLAAHIDPYSSYSYSVFGIAENRLYESVVRSRGYIAQLLRAADELTLLSNLQLHI